MPDLEQSFKELVAIIVLTVMAYAFDSVLTPLYNNAATSASGTTALPLLQALYGLISLKLDIIIIWMGWVISLFARK